MMKKVKINIALIVSSLLVCIFSQSVIAEGITKVGTSAATFLRIPVGARATGMGSAFVSMLDDPTALYWNPSVISSLSSNALVIDHSLWMPGIYFDYAGLVIPVEALGVFGISVTILHTDDMEVTTIEEPMGTGESFNASSFAIGFSYARYLTDKFSIGGTFKYIQETIYNSAATGIAFDIGTIYETPFAGIRLGASISNFGTKMNITGEDLNVRVDIAPGQEGNNQSIVGKLNTDEFDLPLIMRVGISGEVLNNDNFRWTLSVDGINPNDNSQSMNLGSEIGLLDEKLRLRAGYRSIFLAESEVDLTLGVSLNKINVFSDVLVSFGYAYQNYVHLGESNRFTLEIIF